MSGSEVLPSICRNCGAFCPILVTVEDGRAIKVVGDPAVAEYEGYTCPKGRALPDQHNDPQRLLHSLERQSDGSFARIASLTAVDEIGTQLKRIVEQHGPESVALYFGSGSLGQHFGAVMGHAFFRAIKSPMMFSPTTIDKPAEKIAAALHGNWMAGPQSFASSDTWMIVGGNPIITKSNGAPYNNPGTRLKEAVKRGMKLIVVDPRRSDTARRATHHLQVKPGEDPSILAGMIHIILAEGLFDAKFVAENADGFDALKSAVAPFTPDYVAARAGIRAEELIAAARTFGRGRRGMAMCSTGPSFSTRSNLAFYLALCLNTLCGRWARAGDIAANPNVLLPAFTPRAQPQPPYPVFGPRKLRIAGLRETASGLPTAALPDEMLLEGDGQIRAFISVGGNPMSAWPDERKTEAALRKLELFVQMDVVMSASARLAHYVIATPMSLEVPATTYMVESLKYLGTGRGYELARAQYAPPVVPRPAESDLIEEHEVFFRMAQRWGLQLDWLNYHGMGRYVESPQQTLPLDMTHIPSIDELWELTTVSSRVPLAEVKRYPHGHVFDLRIAVEPREPHCLDKLQIGAAMMMEELSQVRAEDCRDRGEGRFPFLLVSRRHNNYLNSTLVGLPVVARDKPYNPLFVHPDDLQMLHVRAGEVIEIQTRKAAVLAVAESDATLRRGVVAITHGFGGHGRDRERDPRGSGTNVNLLIDHDEMDAVTGIPRMSAIPVAIHRPPDAGAANH
ncbi:MAG: molybdopterin-dependent oxidoreductase [Steroidobacteraceae bacterium]